MSAKISTKPCLQSARNSPVSWKTPHILAVKVVFIFLHRSAQGLLSVSSSLYAGQRVASVSFNHLSTCLLVRYEPVPISRVSVNSFDGVENGMCWHLLFNSCYKWGIFMLYDSLEWIIFVDCVKHTEFELWLIFKFISAWRASVSKLPVRGIPFQCYWHPLVDASTNMKVQIIRNTELATKILVVVGHCNAWQLRV